MPEAAPIFTSLTQAQAECDRWRQAGRRIVFTNGCFDLLHRGHMDNLERSRALGDRLVVGLNSDHSVSRLKDPGRPLMSQEDRAQLLAGIRWVDLVVIFNDDTPQKLILTLQPDILVKGEDYRPDEVAGAEALAAWGGKLVLLPLIPGYSTTALLRRIRDTLPPD
ncbi:MAG: D-glycero-beta-D-manno-heptose 1-phosphate adenylyltransferase [Fidelibacterota bacterium]